MRDGGDAAAAATAAGAGESFGELSPVSPGGGRGAGGLSRGFSAVGLGDCGQLHAAVGAGTLRHGDRAGRARAFIDRPRWAGEVGAIGSESALEADLRTWCAAPGASDG